MRNTAFFAIFIVALIISFLAGTASTVPKSKEVKDEIKIKNSFKGKIYEISYPWNWDFEGPSEGPITGFPEFSKLVSPSGDLQIIIGLKGDNRFEFIYDDIRSRTEATKVTIGSRVYPAEEQFLDINEDPEFNIVLLEVELTDAKHLGYTQGSREASLPLKIQLLYRFTSEKIPFEDKLEMYQLEKEEALKILHTFKLSSQL